MNKLEAYFKNKSVTLLGAGISNMPLARILAGCTEKLTVRDKKSPAELGAIGDELNTMGVELITGEGYLTGIDEDIIIRSPGIRPDLPEIKKAVENNSRLTSEMEFFLSLHPCPTYAVTGSDGKSTTTTLTSLLLDCGMNGRVFLGGNIGKPLLDRYSDMTSEDSVAVELSSFQLMTIDAQLEAVAITNITPNHLNWHTSMEEYIAAKERVLRHTGRAVLNYDDPVSRTVADRLIARGDTPITYFSLNTIPDGVLRDHDGKIWLENDTVYSFYPDEGVCEILKRDEIMLPGIHNVANYMTAIALTHGHTTIEKIREVASTFGGVEHRLEFVREIDGVRYINGSIDSSPTRTAAALSALTKYPVVLIAGGCDKKIPYEPLADTVYSSTVHTVILTGETAPMIKKVLTCHELYASSGLKIIDGVSFEEAVSEASHVAKPGDCVILSPASTSFDRFKNFEERGRYFKKLVNEL